MRSEFKFGVILLLLPTLVFIGIDLALGGAMIRHPERLNGVVITIFTGFSIVILWLVREIWFKLNVIEIDHDTIFVSPFLGIGQTREINFKDITAISAAVEPARGSSQEATYIYVNDRRVVEISQFYYSNYYAVTDTIRLQTKLRVHYEPFSFLKAFAKAFGFPVKWDKDNEGNN